MENSLHEYISGNPFQPGDLLVRIKGWEDDIGCLLWQSVQRDLRPLK